MAHVSNALSAQAKRPWALFKYRVKTYKKWGLAWSDSKNVSNQISTFNIVMFAEVLFKQLKKFFIRRYFCVMLPVFVRMFGFGKYFGVTLSQQFLDINWRTIYKVFSKNNKRLKRKLLTKIRNRVDIRRIRFDRDSKVLSLPVPLAFSNDSAFQDMKRVQNTPLSGYDLGKLSYAYDRYLTKLKLRKLRLKKIKKLFALFYDKVFDTTVFWKLFGKRWISRRKKGGWKFRNFQKLKKSKRSKKLKKLKQLKRSKKIVQRGENKLGAKKLKISKKKVQILKFRELALKRRLLKAKRVKNKKRLPGSRVRIVQLRRKMRREPVGRFWVKCGRLLFSEVLKRFFFVILGVRACNICFGRVHNVAINLSARLLALYLATKVRQGFSIKALIKTWRRSIRHFLGCIGWKICFSGRFETNRLRGRATYVWVSEGRLPVSNFSETERLDYASTTSISRYGSCGFKVWLYIDRLRYSHKLEEKRPTM